MEAETTAWICEIFDDSGASTDQALGFYCRHPGSRPRFFWSRLNIYESIRFSRKKDANQFILYFLDSNKQKYIGLDIKAVEYSIEELQK